MFYLANFTLFTVSRLPFAIMYALRQHSSRSYAVSLKMKNYLFPIGSAENDFLSLFVVVFVQDVQLKRNVPNFVHMV